MQDTIYTRDDREPCPHCGRTINVRGGREDRTTVLWCPICENHTEEIS